MKPPILTEEQVTGIVAKYIINDKPYPISELGKRFGRALGEVIGTQRDKDYEHEQQTVREIFEVYDAYVRLLGEEIDALVGLHIAHGGWQSTRIEAGKKCREQIESLKSRLLEEK